LHGSINTNLSSRQRPHSWCIHGIGLFSGTISTSSQMTQCRILLLFTTNHQALFIYKRTKITGWFPVLRLKKCASARLAQCHWNMQYKLWLKLMVVTHRSADSDCRSLKIRTALTASDAPEPPQQSTWMKFSSVGAPVEHCKMKLLLPLRDWLQHFAP